MVRFREAVKHFITALQLQESVTKSPMSETIWPVLETLLVDIGYSDLVEYA